MRRSIRFLVRFAVALVLATALLILATLAAFFALGFLFGYSGHPAGPDLPPGCYLAYLIGAPLLALGVSCWIVFRRCGKRAAH